ncbi:MAG: hypothetical protein F6K19_51395, partial [Cyanothece sp. SIO1E1]|nr:hypothetical protein [Cyanothece sp. SIO1E1]
ATILEFYPDIEACPLKQQTLTFPNLPDIPIKEANIQMSASSSSDLPVFYELLSGPGSLYENIVQFSSPGAFTVRVSQPGNDEWSPAEPLTQTFDVYSIADSWRIQKFGTHKDEGVAGNLADPDFDNIPNLFEYFLGTSPTDYNTERKHLIPQLVSESTYVSFQDPSSAEGLEVWYEWSRNLTQWDAFPQDQVEVYENLAGELVHAIDTSTIPKPHFIRLKLIPR